MPSTAFDTLAIARRLKAAGVEAEQADAIVDAMDKSTGQFVTVIHFDAAVARLNTRIDAVRTGLQASIDTTRSDLQASIDAVRAELRADIARSILIAVGVIIGANALMMTILGFLLIDGTVT